MSEIFLALEAQSSANEVGGDINLSATRLALAVTWDEQQKYRTWYEAQALDLIRELQQFDYIIGYKLNQYDFIVLSGYSDLAESLYEITFDLITEIRLQADRLVSLNDLARRNLSIQQLISAKPPVELFRRGLLDELQAWVQRSVTLTRSLFELWQKRGFLWVARNAYVLWPGLRYTSFYTDGIFF